MLLKDERTCEIYTACTDDACLAEFARAATRAVKVRLRFSGGCGSDSLTNERNAATRGAFIIQYLSIILRSHEHCLDLEIRMRITRYINSRNFDNSSDSLTAFGGCRCLISHKLLHRELIKLSWPCAFTQVSSSVR